ncbi:hypothetical protein [uncultured Sphingomonas sp.]|uniref:hypothetical protein n=1 Tax=uncultured Sphingomonas sp. TaxID=158754 RepID=UPI0035CC08BE
MDLSFTRFDRASELRMLPADLAVLMVGVAARQAASTTAGAQIELARESDPTAPVPFAPADGRFSPDTAEALAAWKDP